MIEKNKILRKKPLNQISTLNKLYNANLREMFFSKERSRVAYSLYKRCRVSYFGLNVKNFSIV